MRVEYKRSALPDLVQLWEYLTNTLHDRPAADRLVGELLGAVSRLAGDPLAGAPLGPEVWPGGGPVPRWIAVRQLLVFYEAGRDRVCVLRILDGRQPWLAMLLEDQGIPAEHGRPAPA